jgi:Uma2 family endonuclease
VVYFEDGCVRRRSLVSTLQPPAPSRPATLDDLARVEGKAELIDGRIIPLMATGYRPNQIAGEIFVCLKLHVRATGRGVVFTGSMGFAVPRLRSGRQSFSPDVPYYEGPLPSNPMKFVNGAPTFAVEVRSEGDHGPAAEGEMAAKRADYFEAGTIVVWDVDPRERAVFSYTADRRAEPIVFRAGEVADAEPAVPGWRMAVDEMGMTAE